MRRSSRPSCSTTTAPGWSRRSTKATSRSTRRTARSTDRDRPEDELVPDGPHVPELARAEPARPGPEDARGGTGDGLDRARRARDVGLEGPTRHPHRRAVEPAVVADLVSLRHRRTRDVGVALDPGAEEEEGGPRAVPVERRQDLRREHGVRPVVEGEGDDRRGGRDGDHDRRLAAQEPSEPRALSRGSRGHDGRGRRSHHAGGEEGPPGHRASGQRPVHGVTTVIWRRSSRARYRASLGRARAHDAVRCESSDGRGRAVVRGWGATARQVHECVRWPPRHGVGHDGTGAARVRPTPRAGERGTSCRPTQARARPPRPARPAGRPMCSGAGPTDDGIEITCGRCGGSWARGTPRCKGCGGEDGVAQRQVMTRTPRGNQRAVVGHREVTLCPVCDARALDASRSAPLPESYVSVFLFGRDARASSTPPAPRPSPSDASRTRPDEDVVRAAAGARTEGSPPPPADPPRPAR